MKRSAFATILAALREGPADTGSLATVTGLPSKRVSSLLCRATAKGHVRALESPWTRNPGRPMRRWALSDFQTQRIQNAIKLLKDSGYTIAAPALTTPRPDRA